MDFPLAPSHQSKCQRSGGVLTEACSVYVTVIKPGLTGLPVVLSNHSIDYTGHYTSQLRWKTVIMFLWVTFLMQFPLYPELGSRFTQGLCRYSRRGRAGQWWGEEEGWG